MVKLILASFAIFVLAAATAAGAQSSSSSSAPRAEAASSSTCQLARLQCKADCSDLNGGALGACLRACDVEYKECLAQSSATDGEQQTLAAPVQLATPATPPEQCYLQLELCLDHCDGDINCNRQCVKQYQKCMGH